MEMCAFLGAYWEKELQTNELLCLISREIERAWLVTVKSPSGQK